MANKTYDYIIVGAGSAGCVLANRLSARPDISVLLLEAGPADGHWTINMPSALGRLISQDKYNWHYSGEIENFLNQRRIAQPRGRVLGGSSSINGMMFIRGHALDYDRWSEKGCYGWSYKEVLPYFKKSETYEGGADEYHGTDGHLYVTPGRGENALCQAFLQAAQASGYPQSADFNGFQQEGFGKVDRTTRKGERWSTARGYLAEAKHRPNLSIVTKALVGRIEFENKKATGVRYQLEGVQYRATADKEVVLSAGAVNTPQLLLLSGVGPASELKKHDIDVVHDLPAVGKNLSDHPDIVLQYSTRKPLSIKPWTEWPLKALVGLRWFLNRSGLAASNHFEVGAFIRSRAGVRHPDLQLTFMPLAIKPGTINSAEGHSYQVHIDLLRPVSLGEITLKSPDPHVEPSIVFNYLQDEQDILDMRASVKLIRELVAQQPLHELTRDELLPGKEIQTDDEIDHWVRDTVETGYHACGSCRMGVSADPGSVVDPALRVHGLNGLRIIDASIMPDIVSGNTNAPTVMIAEKGADLLLGHDPLPAEEAPVWIHPNWQHSQR